MSGASPNDHYRDSWNSHPRASQDYHHPHHHKSQNGHHGDKYDEHSRGYRQPQHVDKMSSPSSSSDVNADQMIYRSPLAQRYKYASESMTYNYSEHKKVISWRKLWLWLAKAFQVVIRING